MSYSSQVIGVLHDTGCKTGKINWDSMAGKIGWDSMTGKSSEAGYANRAQLAMMNVNSKTTHCSPTQYEVNYELTK